MTLQFKIKKPEFILFVFQSVWKAVGILKIILQMLLGLWILAWFARWVRGGMEGIWFGLGIPFIFLFPWLSQMIKVYCRNCRKGILDHCMICLQGGVLEVRGSSWVRIPVRYLEEVVVTRRFLLLSNTIAKGEKTYVCIPRRAFAEGQQDRFLNELEEQKKESLRVQGQDLGQTNAQGETGRKERQGIAGENGLYVTFPCGPELLAHLLANMDAAAVCLKGDRKGRAPVYGAGVLCFALLVIFFGWILGCMIGAALVLLYVLSRTSTSSQQYLDWIENGKGLRHLLGQWTVTEQDGRMWSYVNDWGSGYDWSKLKNLAETEEFYFLCTQEGVTMLAVPRSAFGTQEQEQRFLDCCGAHGLTRKTCKQTVKRGDCHGKGRKAARYIVLAALGFFLIIIGDKRDQGMNDIPAVPYEKDYVFREEDYPEYVSLKDQRSVLEALGLEVPDKVMEETVKWMEENEYARVYTEGYPYYSLLTSMGMPRYDEERQEVFSYSGQVYWFDWEGWDITTDYLEILGAVETLSGGEILFRDVETDSSQVSWEKGSGRINITLRCADSAYTFKLKVMNDWLDTSILDDINQVLRDQGGEKRIFSCGDSGQGAILFYCDKQWAEEFRKRTGIELE